MSDGFLLVVFGLSGAAIGTVLFGIFLNWRIRKQENSVWPSIKELRLYLMEQEVNK